MAGSAVEVQRIGGYLLMVVLQVIMMIWTTRSMHRANDPAAGSSSSVSSSSTTAVNAPILPAPALSAVGKPKPSTVARKKPIHGCPAVMEEFHEINQRFRQNQPNATQPLINYAYYEGQGFGRLVDHGSMHCILALALKRPCAIDVSPRDPYFTWRSFIAPGTYDWDMQGPLVQYEQDIRQAVAALTKPGDGTWEDGVAGPDRLHLMRTPKEWGKGRRKAADFLTATAVWRGDRLPRALLSPNWGTAWFGKLSIPEELHGCSMNQIKTLVQNAVFQPTQLSQKLHRERMAKVLPDPTKPYGAIHLRTVILKMSHGQKKVDNIQNILLDTLHYVQSTLKQNITDRWILADKPEMAMSMASNITEFRLHHAYKIKGDDFLEKNTHSNNREARGKFGHALMAPSIMDWMILHESEVAIMSTGSFGITGARGRGKYDRKVPKDKCDCFQVYL